MSLGPSSRLGSRTIELRYHKDNDSGQCAANP
jgi:hypothetical protein